MLCEKCQKELAPGSSKCEGCGALVRQNIEGFPNTKEIEGRLKEIADKYGRIVSLNKPKFVALLKDYIPEYDKERGLLIKMVEAGIIDRMTEEKMTPEMAIMKAKSIMLDKLFLAEGACEFVVVCFAYMLGGPYISPLKVKDEEEIQKEEEDKKEKQRFMPVNIEERVLTKLDAFKYRLFPNVNIPEGYTKIDSFCFDKFGMMKTCKLPSSMLCIGEYAFSECKHLKGIELPSSLRIIKSGAFSNCSSLTLINIPKGVLEIEDNTFSFCQELVVVEIPPSVGSIGASAFLGCEKLRKLFLPDSIKFIDDDAFSYCPDLTIRCYENSYVHKYCMSMGIDAEAVSEGTALRNKIN